MNKKIFYVSPDLKEVVIDQEGVLCTSDRDGGIDPLEKKYDWSDELWGNI